MDSDELQRLKSSQPDLSHLPKELRPGDFWSAMSSTMDIDPSLLVYSRRYLAYVDILGYKMLMSEYGEESPKRIFVDVLNAFSWAKSHYQNLQLTLFSDSLIIESLSDHPIMFWNILSVIDQFRVQLLEKGILVRGAVTLGDHFSQRGVWISPALVHAYKLESEIAQMPRIVLDRSAYDTALASVSVIGGQQTVICGNYRCKIGVRTTEHDFDANPILAFDPNSVELRYLKYNEHPDEKNIQQHEPHCIDAGNQRLRGIRNGLRMALERAKDAKAKSKVHYIIRQWNEYVSDCYHKDKLVDNYSIDLL